MSYSRVAVVGLGKMGFPIAVYLAKCGFHVVGIDLDQDTVDAVNNGISPIGPEPGIDDAIRGMVASRRLSATSDSRGVKDADVIVVLVPLITRLGVPDFGYLDAAVEAIATHARHDALVIFETTVPVGTTRTRFAPVIRAASQERAVVFSPERVQSGEIIYRLETNPKIVGGIDEASERKGVEFYGSFLPGEVRSVGGSDTAEMVKLAETTYRDLNIAFANDLARMCDDLGLDVTTVIGAANSQPASHIHEPGVGVGGHCIPHYPYLLLASGVDSELVRLGRSVNESMPEYVMDKVRHGLGSLRGRTVLGYGVAYRPGVHEHVSSPAFRLRDAVQAEGGLYVAVDPLYSAEELEDLGFVPWDGSLTPDAHILVTAHDEYLHPDIGGLRPSVFVDGRNGWCREPIERAGHWFSGVGR